MFDCFFYLSHFKTRDLQNDLHVFQMLVKKTPVFILILKQTLQLLFTLKIGSAMQNTWCSIVAVLSNAPLVLIPGAHYY